MYVRRAGTDRPDAKRILSALVQRQPLSQNRHQDLCAAKISWTTHDCVHSRAALGSWCVLLSALLRRGTRQASLSTPQVNAHDLILAGSNNENTLPAFPEKRAESIALPFSRVQIHAGLSFWAGSGSRPPWQLATAEMPFCNSG